MRRVAITGVGAVTPLGNDAASTWDALVAGRSGVDVIRAFDADDFPVNIAAEVKDFDPSLAMSPKEVRRTASDVHFGVAAAMEAARDAGLVVDDPKRVGVVIGSVMGGLSYTLRQQKILEERGWERVSPHWLPNTLVDTTTSHVATMLGARGLNYGTESACATGTHAIGEAAAAVRGDAELTARLRESDRAVLIWSGGGGHGGVTVAGLASELGLAGKPGSGAFHLPSAPNARGVADAWACSSDESAPNPQPIKLLVVSGEEAAADPNVRQLAEHAEAVLAIGMYEHLVRGWADLVLPGTSYLERDGTYINLEGRIQRLRRAVIPPGPDELAWLAKLAERFDVELSPHPSRVFAEIAEYAYGGIPFGEVGERAPLPPRADAGEPAEAAPAADTKTVGGGPLRLLRYRPLFSGPAVERVHELQFQRPAAEVELSAEDASSRGIASGDLVKVSSNGTSVELRARVRKKLRSGVARAAEEHVADLQAGVEVSRA
jgi:anaerobic selenocysteine-containing dehydrogenase